MIVWDRDMGWDIGTVTWDGTGTWDGTRTWDGTGTGTWDKTSWGSNVCVNHC